jgi:hypothetical protein
MVVNRQDAYRLSPLRRFHLRRVVHIQNLLSVTAAPVGISFATKNRILLVSKAKNGWIST